MDENQQQDLLKQVADLKAQVEQQQALLALQTRTALIPEQANMAATATGNESLALDGKEQSVFRVTAKLPPFWAEKPGLWFSQVESQFIVSGITQDSTKFHHVVANLEARYASEIEDIITSPPAQGAYEHLKRELIQRLSSSAEQRIRQLLDREELGDRKPSHFLRHLKSLAAGSVELKGPLLRSLWLQRLPTHVQAILQVQGSLSPEEMAKVADRILEVQVVPPQPGIINAVTQPALAVDTADRIEKQVQELSNQVAALRMMVPTARGRLARSASRRRRSPDNTAPGRRTSSPHPICESSENLCFYHRRFGNRARRCESPCSFSENANGSY